MDKDALEALEADRLERRHRWAAQVPGTGFPRLAAGLLACQLVAVGAAVGLVLSHPSGPRPPNDRQVREAVAAVHLQPRTDQGACLDPGSLRGERLPVVCSRTLTFAAASETAQRNVLDVVTRALEGAGWVIACGTTTRDTRTRNVLQLPGRADTVVVAYDTRLPNVGVILVREQGDLTCAP